MGRPIISTEHYRFWSKVGQGRNGCWEWLAHTHHGYGRFKTYSGKNYFAHRYAWMEVKGALPPYQHGGIEFDHICKNRSCVNPEHLELVTNRENTLRSDNPASLNAKKVYCVNGHKFTEETIYKWKGKRICKICLSIRDKQYKTKAKSKGETYALAHGNNPGW